MSKIVLRLLPPGLAEEEYHEFVGQDILRNVSFQSFFSSDSSERNSIGYLYFNKAKDAEYAVSVLNGKRVGITNYKAVACPAPCQRICQAPDAAISGSIEEESRYMQFLDSMKLKAPLPPAVDIRSKDFKTPLVEYMESISKKRGPKKPQPKSRR